MKTIRIIGLLICSFILFISVHGQSDTLNRTDKFGKKYGTWIKQENGNLLWKTYFYNGEPVGAFVHYHPNKNVKDSLYYHRNSPRVDAVTYHLNGKKASEGIFINEIKDGIWYYYNNDGRRIAEEQYKNGKKHGIFKLYSPQDGMLLKEEPWQNDVLVGEYREYFTTGELRLKWHYKQGKIDGVYESYYLSGQVWEKGQYVANLREGTWISYDREGNEMKIEDFVNERKQRTVLGFKTSSGQWQKYDVRAIAYFYNEPGDNIYIQLRNGNKVMLDEESSLLQIANLAGVELFIFLNENLLTSYEAMIKIIPIEENEAEIMLRPTPDFKVYSYDEHYKSLKSLLNTDTPQKEGNE